MNWLSEPVLTSVINISLPCLVFRMKNQSLVKACSPSSAGREVVNSLVTGLIDMAMDKVVAKTDSEKVVRKANIVQRKSMEMNARGKDEIVSKVRESVEKVKAAGSKSFIPKWVEEPKLPSGWKSCAGTTVTRISKFLISQSSSWKICFILLSLWQPVHELGSGRVNVMTQIFC